MTLLVCWLAFPVVLGLVSLGCGLLFERATGTRLARGLLLPVGFAAFVVLTQLAMLTSATAPLAAPAILAVAAVGLAAAYPWRIRAVEPWRLAVAASVFAVYAAPVVLSGEATFAGYVKLDDTATFLALIDRALEHGRDLGGLAPSSYEATLSLNLPYYPLGSLLPLGIGATVTGQDPAWVFQPYLAFLAALLALVLYELAGTVLESRPLRASVAFVAAQPALLFGYALWGGVKELAAAPLIALVAGLAMQAVSDGGARSAMPAALAAAALLGVLSVGGIVWLAVPGIVVVALLVRARRFAALAWGLGSVAAFALPSLAVGRYLLSAETNAPLRNESELGNLVEPLSLLQLAGVWPVGDFRLQPEDLTLTRIGVLTVCAAAAWGLTVLIRERASGPLVYAVAAVGAGLAFFAFASPWVAAKALAVGAPAAVLAAGIGAAALLSSGRRIEGGALGTVLAVGVIWSNTLAFGEVNLAPRSQLAELETIGERFAGQGPALMTEYQPYGVRHFLRRLDAEGASELRRRLVPLHNGTSLAKATTADIDAFRLDGLLVYRTLVLRRSPLASRPPAPYRLVRTGRYYEVWQRSDPPSPAVAQHVPLGLAAATAPAPCDRIRHIASAARAQVGAATQPEPVVVPLGTAALPRGWRHDPVRPEAVFATRDGEVDLAVTLDRPGRHELWIGGALRGEIRASIDGRRVGSSAHRPEYGPGVFTSLGTVELEAGTHTVRLRYRRSRLRPAAVGAPWAMGPLVVSRAGPPRAVQLVAPAQAERLCGRRLDWVAALG